MKKRTLKVFALLAAVALLFTACSPAEPILTENYQYAKSELKSMQLAEYVYDDNAPSLCEAYADYFKVGACINPWTFSDPNSNEYKLITKQFNAFVYENSTKPDAMHPSEDRYNFADTDKLVEFAMQAKQDKDDSNYAYTSDILAGVSLGGKAGPKNGSKLH